MLELPRAEELHDPNVLESFPILQSSVVARTTYMEGMQREAESVSSPRV